MIQELSMDNFKGFSSPMLIRRGGGGGRIRFGRLSLIIGTNASGKSNIRDGLRFIHGVSRGYNLAEIIGEKYGEGGEPQWKGIRGGVRETVTRDGNPVAKAFTFAVKTKLTAEDASGTARYSITVDIGDKTKPPTIVDESLRISTEEADSFRTKEQAGPGQVAVYIRRPTAKKTLGPALTLRSDQPALTQLPHDERCFDAVRDQCKAFLRTIASMRFLDLDPNSLRRPSIPGQTVLGDKGENLSSVLQAICRVAASKEALIEWTRELTPLDVVDLKFPEVSLEGKIQLQLVEKGGREISAESASDGTLRFLAFAAAVLGTEPARFYFFEEIENGIHPNRAHLLISLLRAATRDGTIQVVGTTHSPALLSFLDKEALRDASLVYRAGSVSKIRSFADIPALWELPPRTRSGELHGSGWFENVAAFLESEGAE
ncbi:MAG: ATP-binding protein [Verrucomicrobia bacterium]|nr:ATP-binding protein [Verrucomicrobiota bacterium]